MQPVIIAIGSNIGNRHQHLRNAYQFLAELSSQPPRPSGIYLTEPIGPSERYFLNAVIEITTGLSPNNLLETLKTFEKNAGRSPNHLRWAPRIIDLDIISYNNLVIQQDNLIIPHPEYTSRLFVLKPLHDIHPNWHDPKSNEHITCLMERAPGQQWRKTKLTW